MQDDIGALHGQIPTQSLLHSSALVRDMPMQTNCKHQGRPLATLTANSHDKSAVLSFPACCMMRRRFFSCARHRQFAANKLALIKTGHYTMSDGHQSMSWLFTSRVACANCRFSACRAAFKSAKRSAGGATAATSAGAASDDMASQQVRQGEGHPGQAPSGQKVAESSDSCFRVARCKHMLASRH